jgi:cytochrome c-type biogenesis protein CcmF
MVNRSFFCFCAFKQEPPFVVRIIKDERGLERLKVSWGLFLLSTPVFLVPAVNLLLLLVGRLWRREGRAFLSLRTVEFLHYIQLLSAALSLVAVEVLVFTNNFNFAYVRDYSSKGMPWIYKITVLWAGKSVSLLFFIFTYLVVLSLFIRGLRREMKGRFFLLHYIVTLLISLGVAANSPFKLAEGVVADGRGLNPMLRHWAMVLHPPIVYVGAAVSLILCYAAVSFVLSDLDEVEFPYRLFWRWGVLAILFLGLGNILGAIWAYLEQGWGGFWAWDPVENAGLIPMLFAMAMVHGLKVWRREESFLLPSLSAAMFSGFGILYMVYLVRAGALKSVHSYGASPLFFWYTVFLLCFFPFLLWVHWKGSRKLTSLPWKVSEKGAVLIAAFYGFYVSAWITFFGIFYPLVLSRLLRKDVLLSVSYYHYTAMILLMALAWFSAAGLAIYYGVARTWVVVGVSVVFGVFFALFSPFPKWLGFFIGSLAVAAVYALWTFVKVRGRAAVVFAHVGVLLMAVGMAYATNLREEYPFKDGKVGKEEIKVIRIEEVHRETNFRVKEIDFEVGGWRLKAVVFYYRPSPRAPFTVFPAVWVRSNPLYDVYVAVEDEDEEGNPVGRFEIIFLPFWIWAGSLVSCLAMLWILMERRGARG